VPCVYSDEIFDMKILISSKLLFLKFDRDSLHVDTYELQARRNLSDREALSEYNFNAVHIFAGSTAAARSLVQSHSIIG